jgi:hypothetical protein
MIEFIVFIAIAGFLCALALHRLEIIDVGTEYFPFDDDESLMMAGGLNTAAVLTPYHVQQHREPQPEIIGHAR